MNAAGSGDRRGAGAVILTAATCWKAPAPDGCVGRILRQAGRRWRGHPDARERVMDKPDAFAPIVESLTALRSAVADFARERANTCTKAADAENVNSAADVIHKEAAAWAASADAVSAPLQD
jgi:hypothetical protein